MIYDNYLELPLKIFYTILRDETQKHLLAYGEEASEEQLDQAWEKIKKAYQENHRDYRDEQRFERQKELFRLNTAVTRDSLIVRAIMGDLDQADEFLAIAGYKSVEELGKAFEKNQNLLKIKTERYKKMVEEVQEEEQEESKFNFYDAISSIEHATGLKMDYNTVTCGEFDAKQRLAQKIIDNARRQNKAK